MPVESSPIYFKLKTLFMLFIILLISNNFGCVSNLVKDETIQSNMSIEDILSTVPHGQVMMYDLGTLPVQESNLYPKFNKSIGQISLVSDYEGIQGSIHLYWIKPWDKYGQDLMNKYGADSGWYWYGAAESYSAKLFEIITPKNNEEAYIMLLTLDAGVVLKNFWAAARPAMIARYGANFESALMQWLEKIVPSSSGRLVPVIEEAVINDANHIFGAKNLAKHKLGAVLSAFRGNEVAVYTALAHAVQQQANRGAINGLFVTIVQVAGESVTVKGKVIEGIARIGTAFIP